MEEVTYASAEYDRIGGHYAAHRREDPRIADLIWRALGSTVSIVNVGAGAGSYEPRDRRVVAVEPSAVMIAQRPQGAAPAVRAAAEALPFADDAFEAGMAVLTVHHWADAMRGLAELRRVVCDRILVMTSDQAVFERFWLVRHYFPAIGELDRRRYVPIDHLLRALGGGSVVPVPIPQDCRDGFTSAFWRRPQAYLDPDVRAGMSTFAHISEADERRGLSSLRADLESGRWHDRFEDLLALDELDLGYRLVVSVG